MAETQLDGEGVIRERNKRVTNITRDGASPQSKQWEKNPSPCTKHMYTQPSP